MVLSMRHVQQKPMDDWRIESINVSSGPLTAGLHFWIVIIVVKCMQLPAITARLYCPISQPHMKSSRLYHHWDGTACRLGIAIAARSRQKQHQMGALFVPFAKQLAGQELKLMAAWLGCNLLTMASCAAYVQHTIRVSCQLRAALVSLSMAQLIMYGARATFGAYNVQNQLPSLAATRVCKGWYHSMAKRA